MYGRGGLRVMLDMPVRVCATVATPEKTSRGIAINESRLMHYHEQFPPALPLATAGDKRGVTVHKVCPLLVKAVILLVSRSDHPEDIEAQAPLIEQEISISR